MKYLYTILLILITLDVRAVQFKAYATATITTPAYEITKPSAIKPAYINTVKAKDYKMTIVHF